MIAGKIIAGCNNPGENGTELVVFVEVALIFEDVFDVLDGVGEFFEIAGKFLFGTVGLFEGTDDILPFHFEMKITEGVVAAVEGVFARGRARVSDEK